MTYSRTTTCFGSHCATSAANCHSATRVQRRPHTGKPQDSDSPVHQPVKSAAVPSNSFTPARRYAPMGSQITFSAYVPDVDGTVSWRTHVHEPVFRINERWSEPSVAIVCYDHFLTFDREIQCNAITLAFSMLAAVIIVCSAVLVLGSANAVPSIYTAIKTRTVYNPGLNDTNAICNVDFSLFISFRNDRRWACLRGCLRPSGSCFDVETCKTVHGKREPEIYPHDGLLSEWCYILRVSHTSLPPLSSSFTRHMCSALLCVNALNLAFVNSVQLLLVLSGAISAMTVLLTCRFILDLFEASAGARFGTAPTIHLSTMPSFGASRSLAFGHVGGLGTTRHSQGIFDADISWRRTEDGESVYSGPDDYGFELQVDPGPWREASASIDSGKDRRSDVDGDKAKPALCPELRSLRLCTDMCRVAAAVPADFDWYALGDMLRAHAELGSLLRELVVPPACRIAESRWGRIGYSLRVGWGAVTSRNPTSMTPELRNGSARKIKP
ncbi:uncharacterized protein BXZ73DRAFT_80613 [Epithele typhae]|uniref:uncharacterized protein n=1 Tax=Epithele typhae TaxID=378194 RepID=UPI00200890C7|nr:uncharacterized protein BXZ73DRAFT_80613 [Epithele typhae]KAH9918383.1 hypothetical protein BXZ73DRAFT_80613 [Epithele typhae]